MKLALQTLARLHAMSYAFFNNANVDVKDFSKALKLMVDKDYHQSTSPSDKKRASENLTQAFGSVLEMISGSNEGRELAKKAKKKFSDRLYAIYKEAHSPSGTFSVLCHGFPVQENFRFSYDMDLERPANCKLVKFDVSTKSKNLVP